MKIAIPVNDKSLASGICPSFGRTPYYLIYDTDTAQSTFLDNSAAAGQGGAGIKAAQFVADQKTDAVLTPRCGENAASVIKAAGIKMYRTEGDSIQENIKAFSEGKLSLLEEIHAGLHHHGGK